MPVPPKQVSEIDTDIDHDFGIEFNCDKEPVLDAALAASLKFQQERLEGKHQPVPPKPQKTLRIRKSGRPDTLTPSRYWRPRKPV